MQKDVVEATIRGIIPTASGCALFLGCPGKTFVIYVDKGIVDAIAMVVNNVKKDRPMTHDLISNVFLGFGISLDRVVINDVDDGTFYARMILSMSNELAVKMVEVDARPSDSIVLALQASQPIFVARKVLDAVEDMTAVLERILKQQNWAYT